MDIQPKRQHTFQGHDDDYFSTSFNYTPICEYLDLMTPAITWEQPQDGVFIVKRYSRLFRFWPKSGKWQVVGRSTIYRSAGIVQFLAAYVFHSEHPRIMAKQYTMQQNP